MSMDFSKIEQRILSMVGNGFRVCKHKGHFYICTGLGMNGVYLWKDGTLNGDTGFRGYKATSPESEQAEYEQASGFWATEQEAEVFLSAWRDENNVKEFPWCVREHTAHYYIVNLLVEEDGSFKYIWRDGTINDDTGYNCADVHDCASELEALRSAPGYWLSREAAEEFLERWKEENASYQKPETGRQ